MNHPHAAGGMHTSGSSETTNSLLDAQRAHFLHLNKYHIRDLLKRGIEKIYLFVIFMLKGRYMAIRLKPTKIMYVRNVFMWNPPTTWVSLCIYQRLIRGRYIHHTHLCQLYWAYGTCVYVLQLGNCKVYTIWAHSCRRNQVIYPD